MVILNFCSMDISFSFFFNCSVHTVSCKIFLLQRSYTTVFEFSEIKVVVQYQKIGSAYLPNSLLYISLYTQTHIASPAHRAAGPGAAVLKPPGAVWADPVPSQPRLAQANTQKQSEISSVVGGAEVPTSPCHWSRTFYIFIIQSRTPKALFFIVSYYVYIRNTGQHQSYARP